MVLVQRANVILEVEEEKAEYYFNMGYNVINESGVVVRAAIPTDLGALRKAYVDHEAKIKELEEELNKCKAELKKLKKSSAKAKE